MKKNVHKSFCMLFMVFSISVTLNAQNSPISVAYVETNQNNIESVGKYQLASTGENVFDIAIIFAANINYNTSTQKAYLHINEGATANLSQVSGLQSKGIKVLLSVLGNHQGAGFCNFPDYASAEAFAQELKNVVDQYGLDGIDFDDEYAGYGNNGTAQPNNYSFVYLITALRDLMPDKLITFYYIGPAASRQSYNGVSIGSKINYSWNAYYGTYSPPNVPGLTNSQLGPAAVWINNTSESTATNNAQRTVNEGYGVYLTYDLPDTDASGYISSFTNPLYNSNAVFDNNNNGGGNNNVTNIAPDASITVSSEYPNSTWSKARLTDGITGQFGNGEWASNGEQTPWAQLNWSQGVVTNQVVLYDRSLTNENINSGTLTFSDGSTVAVGNLPANGDALVINFPERTTTSIRFQVDQGEGPNVGMSEFEVMGYYATNTPPTNTNLAPDGSISASSEYPNTTWSKERITDGITGQFGNGEWASNGEQTPWAQLTWNQGVVTSEVVLYDRSLTNENINSGTLTFSDGSTVAVGNLPANGDALVVNFSERTTTSIRFQVDQGEGPNVGLSEFEVIGHYANAAKSGNQKKESTINSDNKLVINKTLKLYPNPATDNFNISLKGFKTADVIIIDLLGKTIYRTSTNVEKLNIKRGNLFNSGMYIIKAIDENNREYMSKLIIK